MNEDLFRTQLTELSEDVSTVDLRDRVLATSKRLAWQRSAVLAGSALTVVGLVAGTAFALAPKGPVVVPGATPTATAEDSPTPTPSASPSAPPALPLDLANATWDVPAWPEDPYPSVLCAGTRTFENGLTPHVGKWGDVYLMVLKTATGDVNGDGVPDTVALLKCQGGQGDIRQVVAFDRAPDGSVRTIGQVLTTSPLGEHHVGNPGIILDVAVVDGVVQAVVGDYHGLANDDQFEADIRQEQRRGYRWNGSSFAQNSGPTSFPANPKVPANA
ncbi:hypothetical protein R8Z50_00315 [Longispora sp. K20-0274]|uniref:hypothetical protein n=1 Tax=Longispora sp. K20-0274 TaxID=3088255 RepID=UPI00399BDAB8